MSAISNTTTATAPSSAGGFNELTSDEFLKIMFTELSNQDPLQPNETKQILDQIGTIRSIESNQALTQNLESILDQSRVAASSDYIGRIVSGLTDSGRRVQGEVVSVSITREGPVLNLANSERLPMDRLEEVTSASALGLDG